MDLYVDNYHEAQKHLRDIEKDARDMHDFFMGRIRAMETPGASRDTWISEVSYLELQSLSRATPKDRRLALGAIIGQTKSQFTQYHKLKSHHVGIDFLIRMHVRTSATLIMSNPISNIMVVDHKGIDSLFGWFFLACTKFCTSFFHHSNKFIFSFKLKSSKLYPWL